MARVLKNLGSQKAYIVHGLDKLDEISTCAETRVSELSNSGITTYLITPEDFGFKRARHEDLSGAGARENADIIASVLSGKKGPHRDIVLINAAYAIAAAGLAESPQAGLAMAAFSIDSGAARKKLALLVEKTKKI
jgi:anthranilate phosphoribosyltransferase